MENNMVECPACSHTQGDFGNSVKCEDCGYYPMPTFANFIREYEEKYLREIKNNKGK